VILPFNYAWVAFWYFVEPPLSGMWWRKHTFFTRTVLS
jgi:hypothetical protein